MTEGQTSPNAIQIGILSQYIKDFSFESPNAPQIFTPSSAVPELNVGVNVQTRSLGEEKYEVVLMTKMEAKVEGKTAFIAELAYGGVLSFHAEKEEMLKYVLLVEGPRLLFPFARNILANAVRDGGFPQLLINPIDFAGLYQSSVAQINQPAAGSA